MRPMWLFPTRREVHGRWKGSGDSSFGLHVRGLRFGFSGEGLGWGTGQLYLRQGTKWLQVAGFPPAGITAR